MKLTKKDRKLLEKWHEEGNSIDQIEETMQKCECFYQYGNLQKKLDKRTAKKLLGYVDFLQGIVRCAFHRTSTMGLEDGSTIYFDSNKLWREWKEKGMLA